MEQINNKAVEQYKGVLTNRERKGMNWEHEVSDLLVWHSIEHNECKTLSGELYKRDISQGVDFRFKVNRKSVKVECKDWVWVYPSWLYHVTDRFRGIGNYGDYNICLVRNKFTNGFYRFKHRLKELGILLMDYCQFYNFLLKLLNGATKVMSYVKRIKGLFRVAEGRKEEKPNVLGETVRSKLGEVVRKTCFKYGLHKPHSYYYTINKLNHSASFTGHTEKSLSSSSSMKKNASAERYTSASMMHSFGM